MALKLFGIAEPKGSSGFYTNIRGSKKECECNQWSPTKKENIHGWAVLVPGLPNQVGYTFCSYDLTIRMVECNNCKRRLVMFRYQLESEE